MTDIEQGTLGHDIVQQMEPLLQGGTGSQVLILSTAFIVALAISHAFTCSFTLHLSRCSCHKALKGYTHTTSLNAKFCFIFHGPEAIRADRCYRCKQEVSGGQTTA